MESPDDYLRELELSEMRFTSLRRLGILVFTTVLVMWYLLTMLGYVIDAYQSVVSPIPVRGPVLAIVLLLPGMINFLAWTFYLMTTRREEIARMELAAYREMPTRSFRHSWSRMAELLAIIQILYIWMSLAYIFILAAESVVIAS